ncbi:complement C1q tumor necrosis factor-related protein 1-like [Ruditapes philippinarum]|uniref:complement C1q tumor necrosis factor-related protein 1-like n=1 Tax=Ruditapes philippinarum TaxID=129788 RepID=UPI00295BA648|nr:complement C1q tumor necrosis factor-related protein 1-like [Ruditapes philippinarum]
MLVKILNTIVFLFVETFILSASVEIENEIQITKLVEQMITERTSELTNKVQNLERIVTNQQTRIQRLEKRGKRRERTIMDMIKSITDLRQEVKSKKIQYVKEEANTVSYNMDSHFGEENETGLNVSVDARKNASAIRHGKQKDNEFIGKSRRRRETEVVAFSVYLNHDIDHMGIGHHIVFNKVITNEGAGYNVYTGIFTVPVTGLYLFTFSMNDIDHISNLQLVMDGSNLVDIVDNPVNNEESMSSNTVIVHVNKGQSLWIQEYTNNDGSIRSRELWRYCIFSGILLY